MTTALHSLLQDLAALGEEQNLGPVMVERIKRAREGLGETFQQRVQPWMMACFGPEISADKTERNHRFLEEALELVQACGCTQSEAHQLVDYVYGRPAGVINQEVGGVMVTLAAHCLAHGVDMHDAGETELARIWTKVEQIRAKQAAKPKNSPLPAPPALAARVGEDAPRISHAELRDILAAEMDKTDVHSARAIRINEGHWHFGVALNAMRTVANRSALASIPTPTGRDIQKIADAMRIRALESALRRVMAANKRLGTIKDGLTLYERQPSKDDDALAAWQELNDAGRAARTILEDDPQAGQELT